MNSTAIDSFYLEFRNLIEYLQKQEEPSFSVFAEDSFRKSLLLSAASYFERVLMAQVLAFASDSAHPDRLLPALVKARVISRQYHTWFEWSSTNANQFFGFFGDEFKAYMKSKIDGDPDLDKGVKAFMKIGGDRNRLVHQDFATFTLETTTDEIYNAFVAARYFVEALPDHLKECSKAVADKYAEAEGV